MQPNGIIIQDTSCNNIFFDSYIDKGVMKNNYKGVHRFCTFTLGDVKDKDSANRSLFDKIRWSDSENFEMTKYMIDNQLIPVNEFIHNIELAKEYIQRCNEHHIPSRALFIESDFPCELWKGLIPNKFFLGYEVCEIPIDPWTLLDLFNREQFKKYRSLLNENGLFKSEEDAAEFMKDYKEQLSQGLVGDGDVDLYVCRVFEVKTEDLLHFN